MIIDKQFFRKFQAPNAKSRYRCVVQLFDTELSCLKAITAQFALPRNEMKKNFQNETVHGIIDSKFVV